MKFLHKKDIKIEPLKRKTHWKLSLIFGIFLITLIAMAGYGVKSFFDKYYVVSPIQPRSVKLIIPSPSPTKAPKQAIRIVEPIEAYASEPTNKTDLEIAQYINLKDWDYETAIKIAKSENAWNSRKHFDCSVNNAGTNKDGSIDYGVFQINSIHTAWIEAYYQRPFIEVVTNCFDNIDVAYKIYQRRGNTWQAWSAYTNGSYLNHKAIDL